MTKLQMVAKTLLKQEGAELNRYILKDGTVVYGKIGMVEETYYYYIYDHQDKLYYIEKIGVATYGLDILVRNIWWYNKVFDLIIPFVSKGFGEEARFKAATQFFLQMEEELESYYRDDRIDELITETYHGLAGLNLSIRKQIRQILNDWLHTGEEEQDER